MKAEKRNRRGASLVISQMKQPSFGQDQSFSRPGIPLCDLFYCQRETGENRYLRLFFHERDERIAPSRSIRCYTGTIYKKCILSRGGSGMSVMPMAVEVFCSAIGITDIPEPP